RQGARAGSRAPARVAGGRPAIATRSGAPSLSSATRELDSKTPQRGKLLGRDFNVRRSGGGFSGFTVVMRPP
ncbi:hypothetical protein K6X08_42690, partial [Burkholderia contaminans]